MTAVLATGADGRLGALPGGAALLWGARHDPGGARRMRSRVRAMCPSAVSSGFFRLSFGSLDRHRRGRRARPRPPAGGEGSGHPPAPTARATVSAAPFFDAVTRLRGLDAEGQRSVPDDAQLSFVPARWQTYVA